MITFVLNHLKRHWTGPAIRVRVAGSPETILGHGEARTILTWQRPQPLAILRSSSLAFGEAYMRGDVVIEGDLLDVLHGYMLTSDRLGASWVGKAERLVGRVSRTTSPARAVANAQHHYDIGNDFYVLWLDPTRTYSCAYYVREQDSLAQAQQQKLELICRKLRLQAGQSLLDIGCGWGALMFHAVVHYQVTATGLTASNEQADYIERRAAELGVQDKVQVRRGDWRELDGTYDRVVSVGMFEHVGELQYAAFFARWRALLAPDGVSLLHTIGRLRRGPSDPWIKKYIFPGGYLPTLPELAHHASATGLVVADLENLRQHYELTLQAWAANFDKARDEVVAMFDEQFARMWWFYLQGAEAGFRWGGLQLWQMVLLGKELKNWPLDREVGVGRSK